MTDSTPPSRPPRRLFTTILTGLAGGGVAAYGVAHRADIAPPGWRPLLWLGLGVLGAVAVVSVAIAVGNRIDGWRR